MIRGEYSYIWQRADWPDWQYDLSALAEPMTEVSRAQGFLLGRLTDAGIPSQDLARLSALTEDAVTTSAIEGEVLDADSVRSSVARRLGIDIGALDPADRQVEGVVEMVLDATTDFRSPLTEERLFAWHSALFPGGLSGMTRIGIGRWRDDARGPMQVISGSMGRQRVHFEAPPADQIEAEIRRFLDWLNYPGDESPLIRAGIGHLWFVTLHPFDDGNGRIARAVGDMLLARAENLPQRYYSLSSQIRRDRKAYYEILERTQRGTMDVTGWLLWFLRSLHRAVESAHGTLDAVLAKSRFWRHWEATPLNQRQRRVLNLLLDGFEGKMTSTKWATLAKCSPDTALRDIQDLVDRGMLQRTAAGGRSTAYRLVRLS